MRDGKTTRQIWPQRPAEEEAAASGDADLFALRASRIRRAVGLPRGDQARVSDGSMRAICGERRGIASGLQQVLAGSEEAARVGV